MTITITITISILHIAALPLGTERFEPNQARRKLSSPQAFLRVFAMTKTMKKPSAAQSKSRGRPQPVEIKKRPSAASQIMKRPSIKEVVADQQKDIVYIRNRVRAAHSIGVSNSRVIMSQNEIQILHERRMKQLERDHQYLVELYVAREAGYEAPFLNGLPSQTQPEPGPSSATPSTPPPTRRPWNSTPNYRPRGT